MKFSIALGLLFAGLVSSQQLEPFQAKLDSFLRENQHLRPTTKLISAKQNGPSSTVTYQDGPMSVKYQVRTENDQMKIVGIEQIVSFSTNMLFQPVSIQEVPQITDDLSIPPLPLIMPEFHVQPNGQLAARNVFDQVEREMEEMKRRMEKDKKNFQEMMENRRIELQQRLRNSLNSDIREAPLIGAENHDFNEATGVKIDQPFIGGGDHDRNSATQMMQNHLTVGGGDHDYAWMTVQIQPSKSLLVADGHDSNLELIPLGQLTGSGEHDNWVENTKQFEPPIIVDGHENWKVKKEKHQRKENYGRQRRHHSDMSWTKKVFTAEEILPFLEQKLPDMMKNAEIVSVQNKGQVWRKGFPLEIQIKQKDGKIQNISVYFKPRSQELLIDKISTIQSKESENIIAIELETEAKTKNKQIPQEYLIAPKQDSNPLLLGGERDPDHASQFTNLVKQTQFTQNNHIQRKEQVIQAPLLGGQHDINHTVEQVKLLGGSSDPDYGEKQIEKLDQKSEPVFDVTGLLLPGGETDIDHKIGLELVKAVNKNEFGQKIGLELINKAIEMVKDIAEDEVQDIEDVEVAKTEERGQKLQHLIK